MHISSTEPNAQLFAPLDIYTITAQEQHRRALRHSDICLILVCVSALFVPLVWILFGYQIVTLSLPAITPEATAWLIKYASPSAVPATFLWLYRRCRAEAERILDGLRAHVESGRNSTVAETISDGQLRDFVKAGISLNEGLSAEEREDFAGFFKWFGRRLKLPKAS